MTGKGEKRETGKNLKALGKALGGMLFLMLVLQGVALAEFKVDEEKGIVTDTATGLMWQRQTGNNGEALTWDEAVAYCKKLDLAGFDDWRLPHSLELQSIVHHQSYNPVVDPRIFPDTASSGYWSATTYDANPGYAWRIDFYYVGYVNISNKANHYYVRAVRTLR
ncbi:DUF1566 domain-containing protein [Desulfoluna spongiiphila]|uniref:Lcl C-terminal domain-containing protein n=1 Tax=Desulfoluna spongiiphila TaxID=419481 RepID=A0A1G5HMV9_9BACT|nr:DUF1566 domain-containing protein [Desulfoluna spongiiphila]SCY65212.1 Protein of unknown function [Desulfoluna spongiiphila]VVS95671.1 protein of unknown function duf1566 [Desulfoluna spongiiphila]